MLFWIATFFILAVISGALGLTGAASTFSWLAQLLAVVFAVLFVASIVARGVDRAAAGGTP